ncbi:sortase domain-bontaining protein [Streptomyces sp. NPDC017979]|uniref:sortase domain-containing protein n=1 Tax=Streptomyces sp. NPDC017979 TaxID=3365024 RepID=UPI00379EEE54
MYTADPAAPEGHTGSGAAARTEVADEAGTAASKGARPPRRGSDRLVMGGAWALLLLGLWLCAREVAGGPVGTSAPTTGDVAAVGRPLGVELPPAHPPVPPVEPVRVEIPSLAIAAPVALRASFDRAAAGAPPRVVAWHGPRGPRPGAEGVSLLLGPVDARAATAAFKDLGAARTGQRVRTVRADGSIAEFTIDDVRVVPRGQYDERKAGQPRRPGRAELRLVTCGGGDCASRVLVSAYLTGTRPSKP